jgi:subtilisin family serine protease
VSLVNTSRGGCSISLFATFVLLVVLLCPLVGAFVGVLSGTDYGRNLAAGACGLVLAALLAPQALRGSGRWRAACQVWLLAALYPVCTLPLAWVPPAEAQRAALLLLGLTALYALVVALLARQTVVVGQQPMPRWSAAGIALSLAGLIAYPWLRLGALGSLLDILLALTTGLVFGWAAARLLTRYSAAKVATPTTNNGPPDGLVAALALLLLAMGWGFNGAALLATLLLPPVGWLAANLANAQARASTTTSPISALLLGLSASLPLLFADTDTLALIHLFGQPETLMWALRAALLSAGIAAVLALLVGWRGPTLLRQRGAALPLLACTWLVGGVLYATSGEAGLYGDRLFVVLRAQADLSATEALPYAARRVAVHQALTQHAVATQAVLRRDLDGLGVSYTPYYLVNALEVSGGEPLRQWLARRPEVAYVVPSPYLRPLPEPNPPDQGGEPAPDAPPWNLEAVGAPRVWREFGARGAGVVVGQGDSGVDWQHPELRAAYQGLGADGTVTHDGYWLDPWEDTPEPTDISGHGTHTLGIALGQSVGVAPEARWIGCVNLARNVGNAPRYLDCLQFLFAPYAQGGDAFTGEPGRGADVFNNSWGCPQNTEGCSPASLLPAVQALRAAGVFVVASAGNEGPACSTVADPLAIYDEVWSVGATDEAGRVTSFSSVGPVTADGSNRVKPDIVAPGGDILSSYPGGTYFVGSGTSQAGPHVAGVVALLWSAQPALKGDVARTEQILRDTAAPADGLPDAALGEACALNLEAQSRPNNIVGYGLVDAYAAVQRALEQR